jgi:hypothetical protein
MFLEDGSAPPPSTGVPWDSTKEKFCKVLSKSRMDDRIVNIGCDDIHCVDINDALSYPLSDTPVPDVQPPEEPYPV